MWTEQSSVWESTPDPIRQASSPLSKHQALWAAVAFVWPVLRWVLAFMWVFLLAQACVLWSTHGWWGVVRPTLCFTLLMGLTYYVSFGGRPPYRP
jgi:uncharacterized membrane protein YgcG